MIEIELWRETKLGQYQRDHINKKTHATKWTF